VGIDDVLSDLMEKYHVSIVDGWEAHPDGSWIASLPNSPYNQRQRGHTPLEAAKNALKACRGITFD